jgi:uncharacterized protein involved in oxidation of intracellular sulfur
MKYLFILNDPPYGTERSYNGLRLALAMIRDPEHEVRVFLMGDAASCAKAGQHLPPGYYNLEHLLSSLLKHRGQVAVCGTCMEARGLKDAELVPGAQHGTMDLLAEWTEWGEQVLVF